MEALRAVVRGYATASALLGALETAGPSAHPLAPLIEALVREAAAGAAPPRLGSPHPPPAAAASVDLSAACTVVPSMSFTTPRGKFDLAFFPDALCLVAGAGGAGGAQAKAPLRVAYANIAAFAIVQSTPGR